MLDLAILAIFVIGVYIIVLTVYRLFFHQLSSYPGPKLTAATHWVECYHDVFRRGQFVFKLREWHKKYGPIVRINPDELHVADWSFYETLYGGPGSKRDKYEPWCRLAGSLGSTFATPGNEMHRSRRKAYQNFFSKAAISKVEPLIARNVAKLERMLEQAARDEHVLNISFAYFALIMDVIAQYSFDDQESLLDDDVLAQKWYQTVSMGFETGTISRSFPWLFSLVNATPEPIIGVLSKPLKLMLDWRGRARQRVKSVFNDERLSAKSGDHKTVFHEIRDSDLPPSEKSVERLVDEAQLFIGAGSETTSRMLAVTTYHLLSNERVMLRLRRELPNAGAASPEDFHWGKLEQIPYLSAVISEGLRLSYGMATRLPRVAVGEHLVYDGRLIPQGTPVSMTQYLLISDAGIFSGPKEFRPERWLNEDGSYNYNMNKLILNFGKGSRSCVAMNLAYAEMYVTIARIFSHFELELFETGWDEIEVKRDVFTAMPKQDAKGVRVRVNKVLSSE